MTIQRALFFLTAGLAILSLSACKVDTPSMSMDSIRDSKLFDRRINETPRQRIIRECQQESDRFRVGCMHCHTTDKIEAIQSPANLAFTKIGERSQIMRHSPSFGLNQDCSSCHQSKFRLNRTAEKIFGAGGVKQDLALKELQITR